MTIDYELSKKINTIYIISKGRPQCLTAQTLKKLNYPGEWFIVCGTNDETLPEYEKRWGDKVLIFDWYKEVEHTDLMDSFGYEDVASGASPVRNATRAISESRGELRHWQFDDDYTGFARFVQGKDKSLTSDEGQELYDWLAKIAYIGYSACFNNIGFAAQPAAVASADRYDIARRVFFSHNMPTDPELFQTWRGRLNDDVINAGEILRKGGKSFSINFLQVVMKQTRQEAGGLTQLYNDVGIVRKCAYAIMVMPQCVRLQARRGGYCQKVQWRKIQAKVISDRYKK